MEVNQRTIMLIDMQSSLRLFQLISPSLPTGSFTYSQGLEWAIESGWVTDRQGLYDWLESILTTSYQELEIPVLKRLYNASLDENLAGYTYWSNYLVACRETSELRMEEKNRGRALARLLSDLDGEIAEPWLAIAQQCQVAGFGLAAARWQIGLEQTALGYTWSWLENMVMAAVKTVPLGQTTGQKVLVALSDRCSSVVEKGLETEDEEIGGSCPAFAISSCLHETQYTRLFRS